VSEIRTTPAYLAFAHLIIDDLVLADGTRVYGQLGGAGTYAALGAALACDEPVALTCGVGADLDDAQRARLQAWNIDTEALTTRGPHTPRSLVKYRPDGARTEIPLHGLEHFEAMDPATGDVPPSWTGVRGVYFVATDDAPQWPELLEFAAERRAAVLWEISADSCRPEAFERVAERLRQIDLFSINLDEARALCSAEDPLACLERLRAGGSAVVVLRMGADGSLVAGSATGNAGDSDNDCDIDNDCDSVLIVDAAPVPAVVDPTGAGNCYSGAFLAAWCQSRELRSSAALASAAAAQVLGRYGLPPPAPAVRRSVKALARRVHVRDTVDTKNSAAASTHHQFPTSMEHNT
jgi:sugar/nucleoside kinase (ribokinase family)